MFETNCVDDNCNLLWLEIDNAEEQTREPFFFVSFIAKEILTELLRLEFVGGEISGFKSGALEKVATGIDKLRMPPSRMQKEWRHLAAFLFTLFDNCGGSKTVVMGRGMQALRVFVMCGRGRRFQMGIGCSIHCHYL